MSKAGWMVAVLIGLVTVGIALELRRARMALSEVQVARMEAEEARAAERAVLEKRIRELSAARTVAPAEGPVSTAPAEAVQPQSVAEEPEEESDDRQAEREREERIVGAQLQLVMDMAYNPFYDQAGLSDDLRSDMRDILVRAAQRERQKTVEAFRRKDQKASEIKAFNDESDAQLKAELADVLTAEQMNQWEAYEPYAELVLYENLLDGQLTMLSPGLTEDARRATKSQFAKGLKVAIDEYLESDEIYTLDQFNDAQLAGLRLGMEELATTLDEEQLKHAESFITQVEVVFNAMDEGQP